MFGANNSLWDILLDPANGYLNAVGEITTDGQTKFIEDQADVRQNLLLLRSDGTYAPTTGVALYTGTTEGIHNGTIANDFADQSGDRVVTVDKTRLGDFIKTVEDGVAPSGTMFASGFDLNKALNKPETGLRS